MYRLFVLVSTAILSNLYYIKKEVVVFGYDTNFTLSFFVK